MSATLEQIIKQIQSLPQTEQEELAKMLADDMKWRESFKNSQPQLTKMALEAKEEFLQGKTKPLFPLDS